MLDIGERIGHVIVLEEDVPHISPIGYQQINNCKKSQVKDGVDSATRI